MNWHRRAFHATFVLLLASVGLVLSGLAGVGASLVLPIVFLAVAGVLFAVRGWVTEGPTVVGHDLGALGRLLWTGPALAAAVTLAFLGASPSELQTLGGLLGLIGMANYFLRPVYRACSALVGRVAGR